MLTLSGPVELLFLLCLIATWTCVVVSVMLLVCSLSCMRDVISEFNSEIEGSLAFCALMLFLCSILCLMCSGSSLHVECILTFGMLCLLLLLFALGLGSSVVVVYPLP